MEGNGTSENERAGDAGRSPERLQKAYDGVLGAVKTAFELGMTTREVVNLLSTLEETLIRCRWREDAGKVITSGAAEGRIEETALQDHCPPEWGKGWASHD